MRKLLAIKKRFLFKGNPSPTFSGLITPNFNLIFYTISSSVLKAGNLLYVVYNKCLQCTINVHSVQ